MKTSHKKHPLPQVYDFSLKQLPLDRLYNPQICEGSQTGNGIVKNVCGILRTPSKDNINIL